MGQLGKCDDGQLLTAKERIEDMARRGQDGQSEVILYMAIIDELKERNIPCGMDIYNDPINRTEPWMELAE